MNTLAHAAGRRADNNFSIKRKCILTTCAHSKILEEQKENNEFEISKQEFHDGVITVGKYHLRVLRNRYHIVTYADNITGFSVQYSVKSPDCIRNAPIDLR
jgi:hypothetical protein